MDTQPTSAALRTADGFSICVIDYKPRTLDQDQMQTLLALARFASDAVQLRGVNRQGKSCWSIGGGNKVVA